MFACREYGDLLVTVVAASNPKAAKVILNNQTHIFI